MPFLIALGILAFIGIGLVIYSWFEAGNLKVDIQDITPVIHGQDISSDDHERKTVTIGFFSDSHGKFCHFSPKQVYTPFLEKNCDIVLFGGDCCLHHHPVPSDRTMLTEVSAALKERNIPVYSIYGNHDIALHDEDFATMGTILLKDTWQEITVDQARFALCGLYDSGRDERIWPKIPEDFSRYEGFRLLLVHNPDFIYSLPDYTDKTEKPFDFQLSGHLHGGQVHLPFTLEYRLLRYDKIALEENILGGNFIFRGITGLISKGVGCGALPIRFRARPEIHILRFHI